MVVWEDMEFVSSLGHLPDTGGGPRHQRRHEEPPSELVGCGRTEGGREVEAGQDRRP